MLQLFLFLSVAPIRSWAFRLLVTMLDPLMHISAAVTADIPISP
jgi:hypothetical protein